MSDIKFITNQKGKPALLYDGHRYNWGNNNKKNGNSLWRCVNREECNASITINGERNSVVRQSIHTCKSNHGKNVRAVVMDACRDAVCKKMKSVKSIFEKHISKSTSSVPMPSYKEKKDFLYRARKKYLQVKMTEFNDLRDVEIPQILANDFLLINDGEENKMLIFCSKMCRKAVNYLRNKQFFGDGTFKRAPKPFKQFFSIHVDLNSCKNYTNIVPIIYALLPDKSEETYRRLFSFLKESLCVEISYFKCDFETGLMNAVKSVFPNVELRGCYFHFNRAVWKKGKQVGLTDSRVGKEIVRMTTNLPLVPVDKLIEGWTSIVNEAPKTEVMTKFAQYFDKQWLKSPMLICCATERHRTNNGIEGWHRRLNVRVPHKSTLILFLYILRKEAKLKDIKIKNHFFERSHRKRRDIKFDQMYKNELDSLNEDKINIIDFIKNIVQIKKEINLKY